MSLRSLLPVVLFASTALAQFPLEIPQRPTEFPLVRPTATGTVEAWGRNDNGETSVPEGLDDVVAVAAGYVHTVALKSDGTVVAWGYNNYGQTDVPEGLNLWQ